MFLPSGASIPQEERKSPPTRWAGGLAHPSSRMSQPRCSRHLDAARVAFSFRLLMIDLLMSRAGPLVLPRDLCAARDSRGCAREESKTRRASSFREVLGGARIRLKSFRGPCARVGAVRACGLKATGGADADRRSDGAAELPPMRRCSAFGNARFQGDDATGRMGIIKNGGIMPLKEPNGMLGVDSPDVAWQIDILPLLRGDGPRR